MKVEESKKMSEKNVEQENKQKKETSSYSIEELINVSDTLFQAKKECVRAALKQTGKQEFTVIEAKNIVEKFLKKEIK